MSKIGIDLRDFYGIEIDKFNRSTMRINSHTPIDIVENELSWRGSNGSYLDCKECLSLEKIISKLIKNGPEIEERWFRLSDTLAGLKQILSSNKLTNQSLHEILVYIIDEVETGNAPNYGPIQSRVRTNITTFDQGDLDEAHDQGYMLGYNKAVETLKIDYKPISRLDFE
jgi:hypothetical protein